MMRAFVIFASAFFFAGSVSALNITIGSTNFTASQFLDIPAGPILTQCQSTCATVNQTITQCTDFNDQCLCTNDVANGLTQCEQCMFNLLVAANEKAPSVIVGSNAGLAAFSTACNDSLQLLFPNAAMTVAPGWDGPIDFTYSVGVEVVIVGIGSILAFGSLFLFWSI